MSNIDLNALLEFTLESLKNGSFVKLTLGNKRYKEDELKSVSAKVIEVKREPRLSFDYSYNSKDIAKNYDFEGAILIIETLLETSFLNANLFTTANDYQLILNAKTGKSKLIKNKPTFSAPIVAQHDKEKDRKIELKNNIYLRELGITGADWNLKKDMNDKYRQINKYVEIIESLVRQSELKDKFHIVDMGSGKGYLTFALYEYLNKTLGLQVKMTGVEFRKELVDACNSIAKKSGFSDLRFVQGAIEDAQVDKFDAIIALHACDTATDDAIARGVKAGAELIVVAPCCHKQVRKDIGKNHDLDIILKHGILEERQAEIITDSIRAALLESRGYNTKVFEFISLEHTPKNVIIAGIKGEVSDEQKEKALLSIKRLKELFDVKEHYLANKL